MAAYSSVSADCPTVSSTFNRRPPVSSVCTVAAARRPSSQISCYSTSDKSSRTQRRDGELELIWSSVLESLPQGVIVLSRDLKPVYWNQKAKDLCELLGNLKLPLPELPSAISDVCHRLLKRNRLAETPITLECQGTSRQTIRMSTRWLTTRSASASSSTVNWASSASPTEAEPPTASYILVFLENCHEMLRNELQIEQQKYDLTDRETEVWMLLRQEYTYQEIAKMLQISLNTVKTHVKNVYAKKRSCQGRDTSWCSE